MTFIVFFMLCIWIMTLSGRIRTLENKFQERDRVSGQLTKIPEPTVDLSRPLILETVSTPETPRPAETHIEAQLPSQAESKNALEYKFGSKIFTGIGSVAVLLGAGFFLRFAIQAGLINESMRIVIGAVGGAALLAGGAYLRNKYESYAHVLAGTGIGVWHISVFAAFSYYDFISQDTAYILAGVITAIGVALAVQWNGRNLATFASVGGFLAPLLFGWDTHGLPYKMFIFVLILDCSLLAISYFRSWKVLEALSFVGTILWFYAWFTPSYTDTFWGPTLIFASLYSLVFLGSRALSTSQPETKAEDSDFVFPALSAAFFGSVSYAIMDPLFPGFMGIFLAATGVLYILLGLMFGMSDERTTYYRHYMIGIGLAFIAIAVPVQFDHFAVTMVWSIMALVLVALGFTMRSYHLRISSTILSALVLARLYLVDISDFRVITTPYVNDRFITILIAFAVAVCIAMLYWFNRRITENDPDKLGYIAPTHAAIILATTGLGLEVMTFYSHHWLPIIYSAASLAAAGFSLIYRDKSLRVLGLFGYLFTFLYIGFAESFQIVTPFFNERAVIFLFYAASVGTGLYLLRKEYLEAPLLELRTQIGFLSLLLNGALLLLISYEIYDFFSASQNLQQVALSISWLVYALILLGIGITQKLVEARQISIALCAIVIVKVFAFDSLGLSNFFRFVSFMTLGLILLLVGFLYNKYKNEITQFIKGA